MYGMVSYSPTKAAIGSRCHSSDTVGNPTPKASSALTAATAAAPGGATQHGLHMYLYYRYRLLWTYTYLSKALNGLPRDHVVACAPRQLLRVSLNIELVYADLLHTQHGRETSEQGNRRAFCDAWEHRSTAAGARFLHFPPAPHSHASSQACELYAVTV